MTSQRIQGLRVRDLLSFVFALTLVGCTVGEASDSPSTPPAPAVTTAEVAVHDLNDWADFTGRLEAVESVEIRARVGGYVESVHFVEGGRVERRATSCIRSIRGRSKQRWSVSPPSASAHARS
jgi:multidrug efflux pump subunit AcrA (membrane-fusion protein)